MRHCQASKENRSWSLKSFFLFLLFLPVSQVFAAPTIGAITVNANPVSQYTKLELTFPITTWATNLYDPAQIDVHAVFTAPGGATYTINGFAYQGYNRSGSTSGMSLSASGSIVWKVRFSPPTSGTWSYTLAATDTGGTSTTTSSSFTVSPSSNHGFIQGSTTDAHYFAYSDGTAFFPVGENMDWPDENFDNNIYWYDDFMPKLSAQGGNWIRLWMSDWCFGIENAKGTLGNYANSQNQAWCLDYVMNEAAGYGIAVQLVLNYANQYTSTYADWTNNPYNSANGGPLSSTDALWTNATAQTYYTRRWRYITARWGYATNLLDYELFNEVDHTDNSQTHINNGDVANWHKNNRAILNSSNPQTHMVSTSFDAYIAGQQPVWANLDFTQWHQYGNYPSVEQSETAMDQQYIPTYLGYKDAPDYAGEMGTNWIGPGQEGTSDPNGVAIHEVNWASLMSHAAGGGFIWWWDNYVDPNNLYFNWKGISSFVAGEDLDKHAYAPHTGTPANSNGQPLTTLYMTGSQKAIGWVEDQNNQWAAKENGSTVGTVTGATQSITGLSTNGTWQVQWWNTVTGVVASTQSVNVTGGSATLNVPTINSTNPDWAFKMFPSAPVTASTWRVVAGGPSYTDSQGHVWAADENYSGGQTANTTNAIGGALPGTGDQTLYQTERYGSPFSYSFNVPAGSYQVTLKFAETYWTGAGQRVFNVSINGTTVLTNFDIYAAAGGMNKAIDEVFNNIAPSGGIITITLGPASVDNAKVDAIQIIPQPATPTFTSTPTVSTTPTRSATLTATASPSPTFTRTFTPVPPTATLTFTTTRTYTLVPPSATPSNTSTFTSTFTPVPPTNTYTFTKSFTPTPSMTPTVTSSWTPSNTATFSSTPTWTNTAAPPTATFSFTATNTSTNSSTATSTSSFTSTYTPVPPTATNSSTSTSTGTPTFTWSSTPSYTATHTATPVPPTATPTATNSPTATSSSTSTSTSTATRTNTPIPPTATWSTTPTRTKTFTPSPFYTFTQTPSSTPTSSATKTPTPAPSGCSGVPAWNGNFVHYAIGAKVTYNGELYQCIQAHNSQSDWIPSIVPALWQDLGPCSAARTASVYPNPSTSTNIVQVAVPLTAASDVTLQVYTTNFRKIAERTYPQSAVGTDLVLELKGDKGESLANGLYYIFARAQGKSWTVKLLVLH